MHRWVHELQTPKETSITLERKEQNVLCAVQINACSIISERVSNTKLKDFFKEI